MKAPFCLLLALSLTTTSLPFTSIATAAVPEAAQRGEEAFARGDYEAAAAAFAEAYAEDPALPYLYARAQAERMGGHCDVAIPLYEEFLAAHPETTAELEARRNIDTCRRELDAKQVSPTASSASASAPPQAEPTDPQSPSDTRVLRPWYRDPWGGALVGIGAVTLVVGGGLSGKAASDAERARDAAHVDLYGEQIERAMQWNRAGIGLMAGGGALLVAGAIRWIVVSTRKPRTTAKVDHRELGRRKPTGSVGFRF